MSVFGLAIVDDSKDLAMNVVRQIAKKLLTVCLPREKFLVRGPRSSGRKPCLALTFDDGPHPEHTARLLDRLDDLGLKGTFFVIGRHAAEYPELIRRMAATGHEVANHTYTHSDPGQTSASRFLDEIRRTDELLSEITGRAASTVRPPKGELSWPKLRGLWNRRQAVALWNVDPKDFRMKSSEEIVQWCHAYTPRDGDIVLMHDNHPYAIRAVEALAANGVFERFQTTTISRWLKRSTESTAKDFLPTN